MVLVWPVVGAMDLCGCGIREVGESLQCLKGIKAPLGACVGAQMVLVWLVVGMKDLCGYGIRGTGVS